MAALPRFLNFLMLAWSYVRFNLSAQLEYRGAFVSQVGAMFVNNAIWLLFWSLFFTRFPVLRGWEIVDVVTLWAIAAAGFGLANAIFGNAFVLASVIAQGQLDVWMLYPRALLPHLLLGRSDVTAWGDTLFGFAIYLLFVRPDLPHAVMFVALTLSVAMLFVGFACMIGSLSFYLGNATVLAEQWGFAMLTLSTYRSTLFDGAVRLVLFTLVPAGFVSHFPIEALRRLSLPDAAFALAGAAAMLAIGVAVFYHGLRRYESGNLMEMRG